MITTRQINDNRKKSILMNKLKTLPTRKSVKIVEARNTVNNLDKNDGLSSGNSCGPDPQIDKKDEILATPLDSKRNVSPAKALARFEIDLLKNERPENGEAPNGILNGNQVEDCMKGYLEQKQSFGLNFESSDFYDANEVQKDFKPHLNLDHNESSLLNQSKMDNKIINSNEKIHNSIDSKLKMSKTMKLLTKKSEKSIHSKMASPKSNKSITQNNSILQFSSILDSNNDLKSDINTSKMIKENKGLANFIKEY